MRIGIRAWQITGIIRVVPLRLDFSQLVQAYMVLWIWLEMSGNGWLIGTAKITIAFLPIAIPWGPPEAIAAFLEVARGLNIQVLNEQPSA